MKKTVYFLFVLGLLNTALYQTTWAATSEEPQTQSSPSLTDQLKGLEIPENQIPMNLSQEKLYSVQDRFIPLKSRFEIGLIGSQNLTGDSFLTTRDLGLGLRYYLSDRFSLGLSTNWVSNSFNNSGDRFQSQEGLLPDVAYAKYRTDLTASFNAFMGKFRVSMDKVFYFDQYFTLGAALNSLQTGTAFGPTGGLGFSFWWGTSGGVRLGLKDYFYKEKRVLSDSWEHNVMGHVDIVLLLGGGRS